MYLFSLILFFHKKKINFIISKEYFGYNEENYRTYKQ